jgi:isopenicillin N synthase-like dioxygenase
MPTSTTTTPDIATNVVEDLQAQGGMAVVDLSDSTAALHKSCFETARHAFDVVSDGNVRRIQPDEDSAHVTGYHPASVTEGMSRYNAHRRGFVFSDEGMLQVKGIAHFEEHMSSLFESLHSIAQAVLTQMEIHWNLPTGWFQETLGPTSSHSQWHVKEYVPPDDDNDEWLPMHTDPSLISILVHDAPGKYEGAMGLEYQALASSPDGKREWLEIPHHGHAVATVLVGSVLSYVTGGRVKSCKHRVVGKSEERRRIAATLFLRPRGTAPMVVPPSPNFTQVILRKNNTFEQWSARVSRNYMKNKTNKLRSKSR